MIRSRVIEHLKKQQWTAVLIEFVIVVAGVFIGLQVNNWNEARRDRAHERAYLEGIAAELDESIASIGTSIDLTRERIALDDFLIKAATDAGVVRADPGRFIYAITRGGYTYAPTIQSYTFEEIKSAGNLGIFRDQKLVLDLMRFYANVQHQTQWSFLKASNQSEYIKRSAGILTAPELMLAPSSSHVIPTVAVEEAMSAYKRMLDRPEFIEWVPTIMFFRVDDLRVSDELLQVARDLRARITATPGLGALKTAPKVPTP